MARVSAGKVRNITAGATDAPPWFLDFHIGFIPERIDFTSAIDVYQTESGCVASVCKQWQSFGKPWTVVANCFAVRRVTDNSADSGRPSGQETLYLQWF
jgi:hypothetical protein